MGLHTSRSLRYTVLALLFTLPTAFGTALTAILNAHERACYYADVDGVGEKIGQSWLPLFLDQESLGMVHRADTMRQASTLLSNLVGTLKLTLRSWIRTIKYY